MSGCGLTRQIIQHKRTCKEKDFGNIENYFPHTSTGSLKGRRIEIFAIICQDGKASFL